MNNKNFTAQELTTLQGSAENLFKEIVESIKGVRDACQHMSGVVKSEDSGLASAWDNVAQAILDPVTKAESSLDVVGKSLKSYVDQTVANENKSEKELGAIQEEIGSLGQMANGIVDLGRKTPAPPSGPIKPPSAQDNRFEVQGVTNGSNGSNGSNLDNVTTLGSDANVEINRWKILQDTQNKIYELQQDVTVNKAKNSQGPTYDKWDSYIRN